MMNHATTEVFFEGLHILIAAECIGDGQWFIERATRYATERHVFGRAIGQNQGIAFPLPRVCEPRDGRPDAAARHRV
jgi:alkylation response protein AidB-like acyl-CoA dehydrogenase